MRGLDPHIQAGPGPVEELSLSSNRDHDMDCGKLITQDGASRLVPGEIQKNGSNVARLIDGTSQI
jgi:hypothetical protein